MKFQAFLRFTLLALACVFSTAAQAQDCKPQQLIHSIPMTPIRNGTSWLVPVTVNGMPLRLMLDTGGFTTQLFKATVDRLGLQMQQGSLITIDAEGHASGSYVVADEFTVGGLSEDNFRFQIFPNGYAGVGAEPFDGVLSSDILLKYDVDIDFGKSTLNLFSSDHCPGDVLYWSPTSIVRIPFELPDGAHIALPVKLDGQDLTGVIDTGATFSVMRLPLAQRQFGIEGPAPGDMIIPAINNSTGLSGFLHRFSTLSLGQAVFNDLHVAIVGVSNAPAEAALSNIIRSQFSQRQDLLVVGMEVLKNLHLYIATAEKALYLSAASPSQIISLPDSQPLPALPESQPLPAMPDSKMLPQSVP